MPLPHVDESSWSHVDIRHRCHRHVLRFGNVPWSFLCSFRLYNRTELEVEWLNCSKQKRKTHVWCLVGPLPANMSQCEATSNISMPSSRRSLVSAFPTGDLPSKEFKFRCSLRRRHGKKSFTKKQNRWVCVRTLTWLPPNPRQGCPSLRKKTTACRRYKLLDELAQTQD